MNDHSIYVLLFFIVTSDIVSFVLNRGKANRSDVNILKTRIDNLERQLAITKDNELHLQRQINENANGGVSGVSDNRVEEALAILARSQSEILEKINALEAA